MLKENVAQTSFDITVSEPTTSGEGRTKHTTYLVEIAKKTSSRRRYSDFQWLYQALVDEVPGAFVPLIPHKTAMRGSVRFSDELVEQRTVTLQAFMTKVGQHPELKETVALQKFLTAYEEEFTKVKAGFIGPDEADAAAAVGEEKKSTLSSWVTRARARLASAVGMELETTPDDAIMEQMETYIQVLHANIKAIHKETAIMVKASKDRGGAMVHVGACFTTLGAQKYPLAYTDSLASMFGKLADDVAEMAGFWTKYQDVEETDLEEAFQLLILEVMSAKLAMEQRKTILWDYTRKVNHLRKQTVQKEKGKVTDDEVEILRKEAKQVWELVEAVSKRVQREMDIWRNSFEAKVRDVLETYVSKTVKHYGLLKDSWESTVIVIAAEKKEDTYSPPSPMPSAPPPLEPPILVDDTNFEKDEAVVVSI